MPSSSPFYKDRALATLKVRRHPDRAPPGRDALPGGGDFSRIIRT